MVSIRRTLFAAAAVCLSPLIALPVAAQDKQPNFLMIWGDDIGYWNVSAYNQGMMGYKTPNIDRIAREGALFTDCLWPADPVRRGAPSLITGQSRPSAPAS